MEAGEYTSVKFERNLTTGCSVYGKLVQQIFKYHVWVNAVASLDTRPFSKTYEPLLSFTY